jgi:tetratricopeptide (TPR) repeat protein
MYRTAQSLMNIGKYNEAIKLMDKYFILFPGSKYPYNMYTLPFAELYYKAGEPAKANKIMERISQIYAQNLEYYYTFSGRWREYYSDDIEQALGVLRRTYNLARENNQPKLEDDLDRLFHKELKKYQ